MDHDGRPSAIVEMLRRSSNEAEISQNFSLLKVEIEQAPTHRWRGERHRQKNG
jgi:hypothetical protein